MKSSTEKIVFESPEKKHFESMVDDHEGLLLSMVLNLLKESNPEAIESKLGEGRLAKVFEIGHIFNCCVKILKTERDESVIQSQSLTSEVEMQDKMSGIGRSGVKVPQPYVWVRMRPEADDNLKESVVEFFFMEKIKGASLEDVFKGIKPLPDKFDFESFFKKISDFVTEMNERHIFHRDLHKGNVMIDEEGNPCVIDFGTTVSVWGDDDNEIYRDRKPDGGVIMYPKDPVSVKKLRAEMREWLTNHNK
ncbi:MAG: phosphotransferase [Candidatus Paceibacterota bacterium]|jgi:RIO-like serine/threonine protein kinase